MSIETDPQIDRSEQKLAEIPQNSDWQGKAVLDAWKSQSVSQTNDRNTIAEGVLPSLSLVDSSSVPQGQFSSPQERSQPSIPKPPDLSSDRLSASERASLQAIGGGTLPAADQKPDNGKPSASDGESGKARPTDINIQQEPLEQTERPIQLTEREQRLVDRMRERGATAEELRTFSGDLARFRNRGPNEQEVSRTLDQVERLMDSQATVPTSPEQRRRIGMQIVHHAARPSEIDQGFHNTCNVTTLEERMFTTNPSRAAEMIVTSSTTGAWRAPDGRNIVLDRGSFAPGREERPTYPADGERSHASQIFQHVAANDITQRRTPPQFYRQETPTGASDTGERLYFENNRPVNERVGNADRQARDPRITTPDIADAAHRLTGQRGFVFVHAERGNAGDNTGTIGTRQQLIDRIEALQTNGRLPAILLVDANHPAISGTDATEQRRGSWHVISITGYDARTGNFQISNQWGSRSDREVSSTDLFDAMNEWPRRPAPAPPPVARR